MAWDRYNWRLLLVAACLTPSHLCALEKQSLNVGLIEFIPLVTFTNQEPGGLIFEYTQDVLQAANLPLRYHLVSINRSLEQLRGHHLDLVLTLFKTADREPFVRFSDQPVFTFASGFCTNVELQSKPLTVKSRLVHVRGTVIPPALRHLELLPVTGDKAQIRMLQMLIKGRVQAIYSPHPEILIMAAHQSQIKTSLVCYEIKNSRMPIYLGFSKSLPLPIVRKMEEALQKKRLTETFDAFLRRRLSETGITPPTIQIIDASELPAP